MGKKKKPSHLRILGPNAQKKSKAARETQHDSDSSASSCGGCVVDNIQGMTFSNEPMKEFPTKEMLKKFKIVWTHDYVSEEARNLYKEQEVNGQIPMDIPYHLIREVVRFEPVVPKQDRYRSGSSRQIAKSLHSAPTNNKRVLLTYEQAFSHEPGYTDHPGFNAMNPPYDYVPPKRRPPSAGVAEDPWQELAANPPKFQTGQSSSRDFTVAGRGSKSTRGKCSVSTQRSPPRAYKDDWNAPVRRYASQTYEDSNAPADYNWSAPVKRTPQRHDEWAIPSYNDMWSPGPSKKADQAKNSVNNQNRGIQQKSSSKWDVAGPSQRSETSQRSQIGPPPGFEHFHDNRPSASAHSQEYDRSKLDSNVNVGPSKDDLSSWEKPKRSVRSTSSSGLGKSDDIISNELLKMDITKLEFDEGYMDFL